MPAFSYRHIKDLYPTFWDKAREMTEAITEVLQRPPKYQTDPEAKPEDSSIVQIGDWVSRATLDIIGVAGMGHDFNSIADPQSELNSCYRAVFQPSGGAAFIQLLSFVIPMRILRWLPIKRNFVVEEARNLIRRVCFELIREKKTEMEKGDGVGKDILSVAIESGGFSDEDLVNQMMTFLAAGHETTASSMLWASYILCQKPKIQTKLREEIRSKLPSISDPGYSASAADIDSIPYLHAFANEVLRYYPSVPVTFRVAAKDSSILGQHIPEGTSIVISPWATNWSHELWGEDAHEFNPDRWLGAGKANTGGAESNYSFLTFLHGPRSCIGQGFAKAEFAVLLAALVGRFEMEFADPNYELVIGGGVTSKPKGGLKVKLKVVEGW
jgi:cytochrome P450